MNKPKDIYLSCKIVEGVSVQAFEMMQEEEYFIAYRFKKGKNEVVLELMSRSAFCPLDMKQIRDCIKGTRV